MLRRTLRRVNPRWAFREELARKMHPGSLAEEDWSWLYAPTAAALFSIAWQLLAVSGALGLTVLTTGRDLDSAWGDLLFGCLLCVGAFLLAGSLAQVPLQVEAVRRRRWRLVLSGYIGVIILFRAVDYAFGPRRVTHPHPRFVPGKVNLAPAGLPPGTRDGQGDRTS